jgi:hypothetical protein
MTILFTKQTNNNGIELYIELFVLETFMLAWDEEKKIEIVFFLTAGLKT